ncbi:MAG: sigma 54-interacting transcriptional regulator [Armatimonadetes bacterium]|nr:sigma 54-interacting transcriptional regulator [Armatimonadota bacterium]
MLGEKICDSLPVGIIVFNKKNEVVAINKSAANLLEIDPSKHNEGGFLPLIKQTSLADYLFREDKAGLYRIGLGGKTLVGQKVKLNQDEINMICILIDISDWEFYWRELNEQKEMISELEDIFNSSYDEIFVIDGNGVARRINKVGETYYGVPVEEMIGKNVIELEKEGYFTPSVTRLVFQERKRVTITQKTKSGKHLIVTGNPIFNENGEIIRVVVNSRDISELLNLRKQLEDTEQLVESYRQQLLKLSREKIQSREVIARSPQMKRVLEMVDKVAQVDSTVLIMGESGVGKGVVASRLHKLSKRAGGPFITINCGAIPEQLLESELFGYEGGAFTGARKEGKKGLLELANGGTVFLDEITDLPLSLQVKLLQVIQEKKLIRVGGNKYIDVDIRFVAATNRDIQRMVAEGSFREDLYYRLNVIPIIIPPLRYRQEDIPALIEHFLGQLNARYETGKKFSAEALEILKNYHWPGNVRELENLVERLLVTTEGSEIGVGHLPEYIFEGKSRSPNRVYVLDICPLKDAMEELEKQLVAMAYARLKNTYRVADALAINQSTVVRKIQKYQLASPLDRRRGRRTRDKKEG